MFPVTITLPISNVPVSDDLQDDLCTCLTDECYTEFEENLRCGHFDTLEELIEGLQQFKTFCEDAYNAVESYLTDSFPGVEAVL